MNIWKNNLNKMQFTEKDSEKLFFTSDTHFNHTNILHFCARPFKTIEEHDKELVKRWNEKVPEDGLVFHLGDVCFGTNQYCRDILGSLNGTIYLILGNHDIRDISKLREYFINTTMQALINVGGQYIILNHFPLACYAGSYRKNPVWQLYGHVHTSPYSKGIDTKRIDSVAFPSQYDVGVDNNDFTPLSYSEVKDIMRRRIDEGQEIIRKNLEEYD